MAQWLGQKPPKVLATSKDSGFDAMGKEVPMHRRTAGLHHAKDMGLTTTQAWQCVDLMSEAIAQDEPYDAMGHCMKFLDLTGTYRMMAVLLTAELKGKG